jgi:RNA polymerase sigma-70 factor (ECF subfamily)
MLARSPTPPISTDGSLHTGQHTLFNDLVREYYNGILVFLTYKVGSAELGLELAQETFLNVWKVFPPSFLDDKKRLKNWLYCIARNKAIDYQRQNKKPWSFFQQDEEDSLEQVLTIDSWEDRVCERDLVRQALNYVKPQYRLCLLLQILGGFEQREIAELLGINPNSVSVYVSRGMEQLRKAYRLLTNEQE